MASAAFVQPAVSVVFISINSRKIPRASVSFAVSDRTSSEFCARAVTGGVANSTITRLAMHNNAFFMGILQDVNVLDCRGTTGKCIRYGAK
jgi:hypothetical protein